MRIAILIFIPLVILVVALAVIEGVLLANRPFSGVQPAPKGYTYVLVPDSLIGYQACINYHYPPSAEFQDGEWSWVAIELK
ncbi:hypothetical protein M0R72_10805 [Candidatus Pacearchaeota archaeon]|jgi:hypothetical protein|nr:hypothetical protein [Candidatus Pacearchaeota archaeon]